MFDANKLFKERLSSYVAETSRYLKYIFNGHIAIAVFFLITAVAVYYQQWLTELPANFPSARVIAIIFGVIISYTPIKTLLLEADLVFLMPAEHKMKTYFRNSLFLSFIQQMLLTLFVLAAVSPLYFHTYTERGGRAYLLTIIILCTFKGLNLVATWHSLKGRDKKTRYIDQFIRFILNSALFFFIIESNMLWIIISFILLSLLLMFRIFGNKSKKGIAWDILVEKDQHQMQFFYRIANLFTDVPHLKKRFKKRRFIVSLLSRVPFTQKNTYDYLYRIAFVRSGDYLGMYIRLIILGGLLIFFVPNLWLKIIFSLLFIYMSSFQMTTLYYHYRTNIWPDIYPVKLKQRQKAIIKWLLELSLIQTIIFSIIFLILKIYSGFVVTAVGGIVFIFIFLKVYVERKIMD